MEQLVLLTLHTFFSIFLAWSCWCRLVKMSEKTTYVLIRLAFVSTSMAAVLLTVAPWGRRLWPWFPEYHIHWVTILMLIAFVFVQVATSYHWQRGVPRRFVKE